MLYIHIFIINLMLAIGCGFFLWGIAPRNKVGHPLNSATSKNASMNESQMGLSKAPAFRVNASICTRKAAVQRFYVSESEIRILPIAPYGMSEVAFLLTLPSLTDADLSILLQTIPDSGIERNIEISMPTVGSPFPLRKGISHFSPFQKREPPAIAISLTTMTSEGEFRKSGTNAKPEQNSRMAGSSGRKRNKANTSKGKASGGSYSPQKAGEGQHSDDEFVFEAEDASSLTFEIGQDENASNNSYIYTPDTPDGSMNQVGTAEYNFEIEEAGVYKVFGRVLAQTPDSDSVYITMDNLPWYEWDLVRSDDWIWTVATQRSPGGSAAFRDAIDWTFELEAGAHTLKIRNREDGTMLDVLIIQRLQN